MTEYPIAEFLKEYEFVREFGEGVDRMYREMEEGGWPSPVFRQDDFMLRAELGINQTDMKPISEPLNEPLSEPLNEPLKLIYEIIKQNPGIKRAVLAIKAKISRATLTRRLSHLLNMGIIEHKGSDKTGGYYIKQAKN